MKVIEQETESGFAEAFVERWKNEPLTSGYPQRAFGIMARQCLAAEVRGIKKGLERAARHCDRRGEEIRSDESGHRLYYAAQEMFNAAGKIRQMKRSTAAPESSK